MTASVRRRPAVSRVTVLALLAVAVVVVPLAVLVRVRWGALQHADASVDQNVHDVVTSHHVVLDVARVVTHFGDPLVVTGACVALAVVLGLRRRWRAAAYVLLVRAAVVVVGAALKVGIARARPRLPDPVAHAHGQSFPSGHALGAAALWAAAAVLLTGWLSRRWTVAVAAVVPVVVAGSRVLLGVHFVSDVVAGLVIGWTTAVVAAELMGLRRREVDADAAADVA